MLIWRHRAKLIFMRGDEFMQTDGEQQTLNLPSVIAAAAHELKSPLMLINYLSQMLADSDLGLTDKEKQKYLNRLQITSQRTLRLVQHLTTSYRLEDAQSTFEFALEPVNVREVCESAMHEINPYAKDQNQKVRLILPCNPVPIALANREITYDIVVNLLDNAIKHNKPGAKIELNTSCISANVRLAVRSNGEPVSRRELNFSKNNLGKVVQPFFGQPGNSGLGLYIINQLTTAMGGSLGVGKVQSRPSFFVNLIRSQQLRLL